MPEQGDLKVWWIPQVPGKAFQVPVSTTKEAVLLLRTLADYDAFQFQNRIKPDYCNAGGLMVWDDDLAADTHGWSEWESADGDCIDEIMKAK